MKNLVQQCKQCFCNLHMLGILQMIKMKRMIFTIEPKRLESISAIDLEKLLILEKLLLELLPMSFHGFWAEMLMPLKEIIG